MLENRTIHGVLGEMEECIKTLNFSLLPGLIQEARYYADLLESVSNDLEDIAYIKKKWSIAQKLDNALREKIDGDLVAFGEVHRMTKSQIDQLDEPHTVIRGVIL